MSQRKSVNQSMLTKLIKAMAASGFSPDQFEMKPDGTISIFTRGKNAQRRKLSNDWDEILDE